MKIKMARYKLNTGLRSTFGEDEFNSDKEAWESLSRVIPNAYATLYKEKEILVPLNNPVEYCERYNSKYGPRPIGYGSENAKLKEVIGSINTIWIPVLEGITSDEYNVE